MSALDEIAAGAVNAPLRARQVTLIGAPSNIGIRPYDDGTPRGLDRAPAALREAGLGARLHALDAGDVLPEPYRDFVKPAARPRNDAEVMRYGDALAGRVADVISAGRFPLVVGGDCSIVLGGLLGLRRAGLRRVGLAYLDAHADFASPVESRTGSAASMCLALAVGRGETPLARMGGDGPLVRGADVALVGRRDEAEQWYGHAALHESGLLDLPDRAIGTAGYVGVAAPVIERLGRPGVDGFWIHLDADLLSPLVMPAVDSPEAGGPGIEELAPLLAALVAHPKASGMEITIYDPNLDDRNRSCAARLVTLVERAFSSSADQAR